MSSGDTKIKRIFLESVLGLLAKEYEKNPSYGHTRMHDNMLPRALRALGTKMECKNAATFTAWTRVKVHSNYIR